MRATGDNESGADARLLNRSGFTLVELMVATVVLLILGLVIAQIIDGTTRVTTRSMAQASTFQQARAAFELMTRRLTQATLNTYWDYDDPNNPSVYKRQSELHFVSGTASTLLGTPPASTPTHAVFFQAPLGYGNTSTLRGLTNLLNGCGFFIQFDDDASLIPTFLTAAFNIPSKYRYRLCQWIQPSEKLAIYQTTTGNDWFRIPVSNDPSTVQPIAQNVVALLFLPRLSNREDPTGTQLAPNFEYDSRLGPISRLTYNQLPPQVDLVMVALDDVSGQRLANTFGNNPPDLGLSGRFINADVTQFQADVQNLEATLSGQGLRYRIFRTTIKIPGAKWSGF